MTKRTLIFFSIFILVFLIGGFFIYFYQSATEKMVERYVKQNTSCGNIGSEKDCLAKENCEAIYITSCATCNTLEFERCQEIPQKVLAQRAQEKELCQSTGGRWLRNRIGSFCLCEETEANKIFDKVSGCINR